MRVRYVTTALLATLAALLLCACSGDPVATVRKARIAPDKSVTVEQALARYPYFTKVSWSTYEDGRGRRIVEAACDIDMAANCRAVNPGALALARRDVARDYLLARFEVLGFPVQVHALEMLHVTQCAAGKRLGFADPKYLLAVYNRQPVRFFCLEGLNCPGAAAAPPATTPAP